MSVISVYRTFYWTESRLAGQTGHIWETKEEQARCIKASTVIDIPGVLKNSYVPPIKDQQRRDARYHISSQCCLCGIHGYFSPNCPSLVAASTVTAGVIEDKGVVVHTRVRLGGLVDIHSVGARGEYGLIEEAWCDDNIAEAVAKRYEIPVNQSEFDKQPHTDPIIDKDAKVTKLSPLFTDLSEAVAMKDMSGFIPGLSAGMKTTLTQKIQKIGGPPPQLFATLNAGMPPVGSGLSLGGNMGLSRFSPHIPPGAASLGSNCQCGMCTVRTAMKGAPPILWKCPLCYASERFASDHTLHKCLAAMPKLVPVPATEKPHKEGFVGWLKRKGWMGRR